MRLFASGRYSTNQISGLASMGDPKPSMSAIHGAHKKSQKSRPMKSEVLSDSLTEVVAISSFLASRIASSVYSSDLFYILTARIVAPGSTRLPGLPRILLTVPPATLASARTAVIRNCQLPNAVDQPRNPRISIFIASSIATT